MTSLQCLGLIALLGWFYISSLTAVAGKCTTFDELFHLTGGYSYWSFGDFRIQPENGNLPQRWAAIPLLFTKPNFPERTTTIWLKSRMANVGDEFFYRVGNDADAMLIQGRAMMALFGVALGALIFFYARAAFGIGAAFISLTLFAFCPTMLANGPLITSDMASTFFFFASMLCMWRVLHRLSWSSLLLSALAMSGLFLSKFGAFLIIPFGLLLIAIQLLSDHATLVRFRSQWWRVTSRTRRAQVHCATVVAHAAVVWVAIWAFYNFRFEMFAEKTTHTDSQGAMVVVDEPTVPWNELLAEQGPVQSFIGQAKQLHLLPEAFLYGFAHTWENAQNRRAFLNGEFGVSGWTHFFPYCALVKTPLALFVLVALSLAWTIRRWLLSGTNWQTRIPTVSRSLYRTAPLWVLFVGYWAAAISSHLNIGHRHILPTYPVMLVVAGGAWRWTARRTQTTEQPTEKSFTPTATPSLKGWFHTLRWPIAAVIVAGCSVSFATESLWCWPNYLTYFNPIAGGPHHAYRHLIDSSLDWGQDLPALKKWLFDAGLENTNTTKTYISYFGTGLPSYYGINAELLPSFIHREPPKLIAPLEPGVYCISATMLQCIYTDYPGHWTPAYEAEYAELSKNVQKFHSSTPAERERLIAEESEAFWYNALAKHEHARFARLASYLRQREPDYDINHSILIYLLNESDVQIAQSGPLSELSAAP